MINESRTIHRYLALTRYWADTRTVKNMVIIVPVTAGEHLKNLIADSCGNIEQHITQWLEKMREEFKRRHLLCAHKKNNLHVRRSKWKQRKRWLMGSIEGKEAVAAFRELPSHTPVKLNVGGVRFEANLEK